MESFVALAVTAFAMFSYANNIDIVRAGDPDPLQDFCVAEYNTKVHVNGFPCKDKVTAEDFLFKGLDIPGNTSNQLEVAVTPVFAMQLPGLNTLGISMARIDFAPWGGLNPPHTHPRASELLVVMEGTLYVGFITTNNELVSKTLEKGDVFVFPKGLVHFQQNVGPSNAVAIAALSSQNPGVQQVAQSLFGTSNRAIEPSILARAFQINPSLVQQLQKNFSAGN